MLQPPVYYFSMVTNSTPIFGLPGSCLQRQFPGSFILLCFPKEPPKAFTIARSAINRLSRFICVPVNCPSGVAHPCNSKYGSTISTHRKTVVTVSPGKYTTLSRTVARNSLIVSIWVVVTRSNSRFFVCNVFINSASLARYFSNSDNFSSKTPTFAAFKLSLFCTFRRPATMFLYFPGICSVRPSIFQFSFVAPILLQRRQLPSQLPPKSNTFSYNFLYCFKMYLCNPFFSVVAHHKTAILFI